MIADLGGLLLVNACFLAAGLGVLAACGWWRGARRLPRSLGCAYLAGVAYFGVVAQALYVLGASLARWQVLVVCAVPVPLAVAALLRTSPSSAEGQRAGSGRRRWLLLAGVPAVAFLALLAVDLWWQPLWAYDSWTFWTPKAHALYQLGGLRASWFSQADLLNRDYPILLPAVEAAGFRFTGYETSLLDVQSLLFLGGFLLAVYEVCARRARPLVLWTVLALIVVAPSVADQLASAEADIPEAALFAVAGLCAYVWLTERRPGALSLAAVLAAGAAATKVEGLAFTVALFVSLAAVSARGSRAAAARALAAGVLALAAGILPWRLWMRSHGIPNQAGIGRFTLAELTSHAARAPEAAAYLGAKLLDPRAWLVLVPLVVVALVEAWRHGPATPPVFVVVTCLLGLAGLVLAYWTTPFPFHEHLATSARRVITAIVFFAAAVTPLLDPGGRPGYPAGS